MMLRDRRPLQRRQVSRPENTSPDSAPSAGARLMSTPNVRVGKRGSANISSEYGSALDSSATAQAVGKTAGESSAAPAWATPMGTMTSAPTNVPSASGCAAVRGPALRPNRM